MDGKYWFENDVKMYGTQTLKSDWMIAFKFENDVKMFGTQTLPEKSLRRRSLRMM